MSFLSKRRHAVAPAFLVAFVGVAAVAAPGCDGEDNPLCCNEGDFQVGGTIEGTGEIQVALQAVADVSGIAAASVDDLTTACRAIATDLEAPEEERKAANATADKRDRMKAWCALAVSAIGSFKAKAGGSLELVIVEPKCSANVSAKASCQGGCSGSAECDVKVNPPVCEGGKLEIACKGSCTGSAGASVSCTGNCTGSCEGKCTADAGGVECAGKCEGTCKGAAEGGTGEGIQADGTCSGTCEGTCEVTAPSATCSGTCEGSCSASCEATADVAVKCDGACSGEFEPIKCEGGELKGGCQVEAKCEANCDASVQAAGKLKAVLEANLGLVAALEARIGGLLEVSGTLVANIDEDFLVDIKVACIPVVIGALEGAFSDIRATVEGSVSVIGSVGG
jgi:hypothetical protein